MNRHTEEMRRQLEDIISAFPNIYPSDIPGIDLYMDQVTTFLHDNLRGLSRDPDGDKFLTKTMINNYVKNKVLIPPVKKKYTRDHMMLLIMIYYMKSFLSIGDIRTIVAPLEERYAKVPADPKKDAAERKKEAVDKKREQSDRRRESQKAKGSDKTALSAKSAASQNAENAEVQDLGISDIYETIITEIYTELPRMQGDINRAIELSEGVFADVPEEDRPFLQRFDLICRLSAEVFVRKLFIEKLLDADNLSGE